MAGRGTTSYESHTARSTSSRSRPRRPRTSTSHQRPSTSYSTATVDRQTIICAIGEARGISPTVGVAFLNINTSDGTLCQLSDSQTYSRTITKLAVKQPSVLILPISAVEPKSKLLSALEEDYDGASFELVYADRGHFSERAGHDAIHQLGFPEDIAALKISISDNYYAVCCFAAALKYVELEIGLQWSLHSLRLRFEASEDSIMIDSGTLRSLELIENSYDGKSKACLFGLLNRTQTPMGARLLRSNLLQPLTDTEHLSARWDAVDELITNEELFHSTAAALKHFLDADKILTDIVLVPKEQTLHTIEQAVNHVLALKHFLSSIGAVHVALSGSMAIIFRGVFESTDARSYDEVLAMINNVINGDTMYAKKPVELRNQRNYAVKEGYNALLEVARHIYSEAHEDIDNYVRDLATEHDLALELKFEHSRQYYIRLPPSDLEDRPLPPVFINVYRKGKYIECQTMALKKQSQRIHDAHQEVLMMGDNIVQGLLADIRTQVSTLFKISESVALLDMLLSFATMTIENEYVRPHIAAVFALRAARHPVKERHHITKFIANDIFATQMQRFKIITGCNMSGKSTYIRSVALICIMAQIGSFVPAKIATIPIIRQILARVSTDDSIEANMSTFSAEMRDAAYILDHVNRDSLVIIDELGRGTSTPDGLAIALAISEALVSSRAFVWFVTHFRDLAHILSERAGVSSLHLSVDTSQTNTMRMLYQTKEGVEDEKHYGLMIAKVLPWPPGVIDKAAEVSYALRENAEQNKKASPAVIQARKRRLVLNLQEQLQQAHRGVMNDEVLRDWLKQLQKDFIIRMMAIDRDAGEISISSVSATEIVSKDA